MRRLLAALLLASPVAALGQVMYPCDVPSALRADPARYAEARLRLGAMSEHRAALEAVIAEHNKLCPPEAPAAAACRQPQKELQEARAEYDRRRAEHKAQLLVELDAATAALGRRRDGTRERLAQIPYANPAWTLEMEQWMRLGNDARTQARDDAFFAALDLTLARVGELAFRGEDLGAKELVLLRNWIQREAKNVMRADAVAAARERARTARSWSDVVPLLETIRAQHEKFYKAAARFRKKPDDKDEDKPKEGEPEPRELWEGSTHTLLELMARLSGMDPAVAGASRVSKLWTDTYYGWAASLASSGRLGELAELQEFGYPEVTRLGKQYIDDYRRFLELRRARRLLAQLVC